MSNKTVVKLFRKVIFTKVFKLNKQCLFKTLMPCRKKLSVSENATMESSRIPPRQSHREKVKRREYVQIETLVQKTWYRDEIASQRDGKGLFHQKIQVKNVERIMNPELLDVYRQQKHHMQNQTRPQKYGQIWTTNKMDPRGLLRSKMDESINEHYLFHGTKKKSVSPIIAKGFSMDCSDKKSLLGEALYFADNSAKADMYADDRENRTKGDMYMFLVKVLLGHVFLYRSIYRKRFHRPPCRRCKTKNCSHPEHLRYNSIFAKARRRRSFAVYNPSQCYPEYLITYERLSNDSYGKDLRNSFDHGSRYDDEENEDDEDYNDDDASDYTYDDDTDEKEYAEGYDDESAETDNRRAFSVRVGPAPPQNAHVKLSAGQSEARLTQGDSAGGKGTIFSIQEQKQSISSAGVPEARPQNSKLSTGQSHARVPEGDSSAGRVGNTFLAVTGHQQPSPSDVSPEARPRLAAKDGPSKATHVPALTATSSNTPGKDTPSYGVGGASDTTVDRKKRNCSSCC